MPEQDFKAFAISGGSNVISQSAYELLAALATGFVTGTALSDQLNKVWRQSSVVSSVVAQFISDTLGEDVLDDGDLATLQAQLEAAILALAGSGAEETIASASTTDLGSLSSTLALITGVTSITSFGSSASVAKPLYTVRFNASLQLTYSGTAMILPTAANIVTGSGDAALFEYLGSGNWRCLFYQRANGLALKAANSGLSQGNIGGLLPYNIGTATLNATTGQATDSSNQIVINSTGVLAWNCANGNAANGNQGGATVPNNTTLHFFVIQDGGGATAIFSSTSLTPTLPGSYLYYRRIFSLRTAAAGNQMHGNYQAGNALEVNGGGLRFWFADAILDISETALISVNRTAYVLSTPQGIVTEPSWRAKSEAGQVLLMSPWEPDQAPDGWFTHSDLVPGADLGFVSYGGGGAAGWAVAAMSGELQTDTNAQIAARGFSGSATSLYFVTRGFLDYRR